MVDRTTESCYIIIVMNGDAMRFDKYGDVDMTSLQGYVKTTYDKLIEVFGEPHYYDGGKTTCEWTLKFADGTVATIYDYKEDTTPKDDYDWHVGGFNQYAVKRVTEVLS